jgi:putative membrane protein
MAPSSSKPSVSDPAAPSHALSVRRLHPYAITSFWTRPTRPKWVTYRLLLQGLLLLALAAAVVIIDAGSATIDERFEEIEATSGYRLVDDVRAAWNDSSATETSTAADGEPLPETESSFELVLIGWMLLGLIATIVGANLIAWWRIWFGIDDKVVWMTGGVIRPLRRVIPLSAVQLVDITASIWQQPIGVCTVRVESAASEKGAPDLVLTGVRDRDAAEVRRIVRQLWNGDAGHEEPIPAVTAKTRDLLIAGATSFELGRAVALLALAGSPISLVSPRIGSWFAIIDFEIDEMAVSPLLRVTGMVGFSLALLWIVTTILFAVDFNRYRLQRHGRFVELDYGRVTKRWRGFSCDRVQALLVSENIVQQALGLATMRVAIAGDTQGDGDGSILVPSSKRQRLAILMEAALPDHAMSGATVTGASLRPAGYRTLWQTFRPIFVRIVPLLIVIWVLLEARSPYPGWWVLVLSLPVVPYGLYRCWQDQDAGWCLERGDRLVTRERRVSRITTCARIEAIQFSTIEQGFLARLRGGGGDAEFEALVPGSSRTWLERKLNAIFEEPDQVQLSIPDLELQEAKWLQQIVGRTE